MHINRVFLLFCQLVYGVITQQTNWQLIYSQFHQWSILDYDGWIQSNGLPAYINQCNHNGMDIICLDGDHQISEKQINSIPSHFEIQFFGDVYSLDSWDEETGFVKLDGISQFSVTQTFNSFSPFSNQCGAFWENLVQITTVHQTMQHFQSFVQMIIGTTLDSSFTNESFNFRNIQLWARLCHKTCQTCNGDSEDDCLTCFQGSPNLGICSPCSSQNTQYFQSQIGCVQECERNSLADDSLNCIMNSNIQVSIDYNWQVKNEFGDVSSRQINCNGLIIEGIFNSNEWIGKNILISQTTMQLRIRVTFYIFYPQQWEQFSQIEFSMNGQMINLVYYDFGQLKPIKSKVIYSGSGSCIGGSEDFKLVRTEQIVGVMQYTSTNVSFKIKSKQNWGIKDIYIDQIQCSLYCDICLDETNCAQCQSGYYNHHGQCVNDCPLHSDKDFVNRKCIDFDEETQKTSYLLKAFYLESSSPSEATEYFDLISQTGSNFIKGVKFSYLRSKRIFGGAITWHNAVFSKTYTIIPAHYGIRVRFQVILGDDFANGQFCYQINGGIVHSISSTTPYSDKHQEWGDIFEEQFYQINEYISHTGSQLTVKVECISDHNKAINESFCGIADYFITILECPMFCNSCTSWASCITWNTQPFLDPISHICVSGYILNQQTLQCEINSKYCGNGIIEGNEECDDMNTDLFDGCSNCLYICQPTFPDCVIYHPKVCYSGYILNIFDDQCSPICGDNIIVPDEECDDGNLIPFDGCHLCHYQCQESCLKCDFGLCSLCSRGWILQEQIGQCLSNCGDGIVNGQETCEDFNDSPFDGCFECRFQCEELCTTCIQGVCYECDVLGWQINENHKCEPICNDGLILGIEECEDMNQIPYDGCFECRFQCEELCTTCIEGVCYECDVLGWQINENHKCEPICNDGLVMGLEECDDMNLIPYDGCNECKFQCHQYCLQCVDGVCVKCAYGYHTYLGQCKSFCGDGQQAKLEECDDDNLNNVDGCSKECEIEENWACITQDHQASTCLISKIPLLQLSLHDKNSTEMQIVHLTFNAQIQMISKDIKPQFSFRIIDLEDIYYQIILSPITPLTNNAQFVEYDIQIYFNISVYRPMLIVEITNITNQYQQTFKSLEGRIYLRDSEVITEGEKQSTRNAKSFSQIVIYTMGGTVAIAILTGSLELVWNLLDMLQLLSYIKYINIAFPLNLDTYFEIFKLITISPLVQYLGVDDILTILNGGVVPFIETKNKFKDDQINAYFLGNFLSFLLCFILAYSNYFFSKIMSTLLYKLGPWVLSMSNLAFLKIVHKAIKYFRKNAQKFYYSIFIRMFLANYYEIMFAACIQLNNLNWENTNMAVNSALSIMTVVGEAYFIYNIAFKLYSFTKNNTVSNKRKYDSIFEGVKENKANFWVMQLNSILLLKKFIFMVIIVNFQDEGTIQTIFLSISSAIYLAYLIKTKPFDSKSEFIKQIINEFVISFNTLTFLIYKYKQPLQLGYSQVMILGWLHITLFSVTLCSTLLIDIYHQISIIWNKLKLNQQQKLIKNDSGTDKQQLEQQKSFQGQCTKCNSNFTQFNIQLILDCKIHRIGVCCQRFTAGCPQCEQQSRSNLQIGIIKNTTNIEQCILKNTENYSSTQKKIKDEQFQKQNQKFEKYGEIFIFKNSQINKNKGNLRIENDLQ